MKLTNNFRLREFEKTSVKGINNRIPRIYIPALVKLSLFVLEPLRKMMGCGIIVTSGYRCPELNKIVGGAKESQHLKGEAADIVPTVGNALQIYRMLLNSNIPFDKCIYEKKNGREWIHISYKDSPRKLIWASN